MKKITVLVFVFFVISIAKTTAQCNLTETLTICDMTIIDGNTDGTPDGIINLYDAYNNLTGGSISSATGSWFDPNYNFALDENNGDLYLWDLDNSSEAIDDYQFQLIDPGSSCPGGVVITLNLILGPFSGYARPVLDIDDVNLEICDVGSYPENICVPLPDVDLFETLESLPSPHLNGQWIYNGNSPNFVSLSGSNLTVTIPYTPGPPLVDQETFELTYRVTGIPPCNSSMETTVNVSVTRQVFSGYPQNRRICELDIINGNYNADINLSDDEFLLLEDIEGVWLTDGYGQITTPNDPVININDVYQQIITNRGMRFGCEEVGFTYAVDQRSGVCGDMSSTVRFKIYEYLRPFSQRGVLEFCEDSITLPTSINLYDQLEFTTENGVLFDYFDNTHTDWVFVSGVSDLGLISNGASGYSSLGTINLTNAVPGTYVFEYVVYPEINCPSDNFIANDFSINRCVPTDNRTGFCSRETAQVVLTIHPKNYAGEDTSGLEFCETDSAIAAPLDLFTLLGTNGIDDPIYQGAEGRWIDISTGLPISNPYTLPEINNQQTFNFQYTTLSSNGCLDRASLSFTVYEEYQSGSGGTLDVCDAAASVDLFDSLTGSPNTTGTWTGPNGYVTTSHNAIFDPLTSDQGTYTYTVPDNVLCTGSQTTLNVVVHQSPNAGNDILGVACRSDLQIDLLNYLDSSADSGGTFLDLDTTNMLAGSILNVSQLTAGTYNFQYEIQGHVSCSLVTAMITIIVQEMTPASTVDQTFCASDGASILDLQATGGVDYNWYENIEDTTPLPINHVLEDGEDYFVAAIDDNNCESPRVSMVVTILPIDHVDCDDCIKDGISVNGDNLNDAFDLCNLPISFPNFQLEIFNRYGTIVYKGNQNTELFRGVSNVSSTMGKELPTGIYFYVFDPKDGKTKPFQGNLYLSR
ncbi:gliding motility-associated C-terminal domain-containing protein [Seonamhaeicola sp.]|uniref:gliding motility-associated C-terminal domain-containing protein n=1 Tax=Seonamhaeicola sp. TaxID=1912245 RepID=UPI002634B83B|nr:gliding motility-associated C-terminal domain-containing protein [Seonamhaeicola sp.]